MMRSRASSKRSAAEWAWRGVLALMVAASGYVAVTRTAGYAMRATDLSQAFALAPGDARVTALYAQSLAGLDATRADRQRADRLAVRALRRDPTTVAAVSTLALNAQLVGRSTVAKRLFTYAERLSRRDLRTALWGVEEAVARGDVAGALRHYDVALRTSPEAPTLLFPILASAMSDPGVRAALAHTLASQPLWTQGFIEYAAGHAADARARAGLFTSLMQARVPVSANAQAAATDSLIKAGLRDDAWAYYHAVHRDADRLISRDPRFTARSDAVSLLDWSTVEVPGVSTTVGGGLADVAVDAGVGGTVLRQLQLLTPGDYRLDGHAGTSDPTSRLGGYWALACLDGRELGRVALSSSGSGAFGGRFSVPAGCSAQYLSLVVLPNATQGGSVQVDRARLAPIGAR